MTRLALLALLGLFAVGACSDETLPGDDGGGRADAVNDPSCPTLAAAAISSAMVRSHRVCSVDRNCVVLPVSCCIDPRGELVVNMDGNLPLSDTIEQYDTLCPETCACDTTHPGTPGCVRGNQVCGYN